MEVRKAVWMSGLNEQGERSERWRGCLQDTRLSFFNRELCSQGPSTSLFGVIRTES